MIIEQLEKQIAFIKEELKALFDKSEHINEQVKIWREVLAIQEKLLEVKKNKRG
jgi:hypothetical protein